MKVLLATDGSTGAQVAEQLVASLAWPDPTEIVVLRIDRLLLDLNLPPDALSEVDELREREATKHFAALEPALAGRGRGIKARVVVGRAASVIVDEARRMQADVIVVGSRGLGPFRSAVLGSVAAEVVDHGPCPVLVARVPRVSRLVLGTDGSPEAALAEALVSEWPIFHGLPVEIVAVAAIPPMVSGSFVRHAGASAAEAQATEAIRAGAQKILDATAKRLNKAGVKTQTSVRGGDPAEQLIEAARETDADLIVTGSRGATGLERLLLGSVARGVLQYAPSSVLIARRASKIVPVRGDRGHKGSKALAR
jgi:nucleotide-binding universal stress UspA family protein